MSYVTQEIELN